MTLREAMCSRVGTIEAERQIGRGASAWVVERTTAMLGRPLTAIVFGRNRSDALRRASTPGRLGEGWDGDVDDARRIESGWDDPIVWPFDRRAT